MNTEQEFTLKLSYWEMRNLLFAIRAAKAKSEKAMRSDPDFTPEPGRINLNEARIKSLDSAGTKIMAGLAKYEREVTA